MAKKSEALSQRQLQSQLIMRSKAARKKRQQWIKKAQIGAAVMFSVLLIGGGLWGWKSGAIARTVQTTIDGGYKLTAKAGFSVKAIYLEGRNRTSMDDINKALGIAQGEPIFQLSLAEMRERLEKIESVHVAAVERSLPGTLYVRIVEREPVALWQHQGKIALVDDQGVVMNGIDSAPYRQLPLIVGDNAPAHITELMTILAASPDLTQRFAAAVYVGERRWNIRLNGDVEVKLPETNAIDAWKKLAELETKQKLLDRDIKVIDLRLAGRMFIQVSPEELRGNKQANGAKET